MLMIGPEVPMRVLSQLNRDLEEYHGNTQRFINKDGKLFLTKYYKQHDMWIKDWSWNTHK